MAEAITTILSIVLALLASMFLLGRHLGKRLDDMNGRFGDMDARFGELRADMQKGFDETKSRLQHIEVRIDDTNKRIDDVARDVAALRDRTGALEGSLRDLHGRAPQPERRLTPARAHPCAWVPYSSALQPPSHFSRRAAATTNARRRPVPRRPPTGRPNRLAGFQLSPYRLARASIWTRPAATSSSPEVAAVDVCLVRTGQRRSDERRRDRRRDDNAQQQRTAGVDGNGPRRAVSLPERLGAGHGEGRRRARLQGFDLPPLRLFEAPIPLR